MKPTGPAPAPTMLHTRVVLEDGTEVLERTTVVPAKPQSGVPAVAGGAAPAQQQQPQPLLALPPVLERDVFQLARRIALQADVDAAVRVLRQGLSRLTNSPDAMCVFHDPKQNQLPDGKPAGSTSPLDQAHQLISHVATTGERVFMPNAILEPVGPAPARAVLVLRRTAPHAPYGPLELAIVASLATSMIGILGHFHADHEAKKEQAARDAKTPFRPEALAERRRGNANPGKIIPVPRTWIRWAFPTLIFLVIGVIAAAALVHVPTYSTGMGIVVLEGQVVTTQAPGTVAELFVGPSSRVSAGDPLVRMHAQQEDAELAADDTDYRNALGTFLMNPGDEGARIALATISTRRQHAEAEVDARTLRAPVDGMIGDIRVHQGQLMMPGAEVLKVVPVDAAPSVIALLPGYDRPRLEVGMTVQIELPGYRKKREEAIIDSIGTQVVGPEEARRALGDTIGEGLPIGGPVVIVRAHLSSKTFEAEGRDFEFHDGMVGKAEVRVSSKSLLRTLIPGGEDGQ